MSFWTDERQGELERYALRRLSASEIAEVMGDGCTRNAVLGRAWRTGVELRSGRTNTAQAKAGRAAAEARRLNPIHLPREGQSTRLSA